MRPGMLAAGALVALGVAVPLAAGAPPTTAPAQTTTSPTTTSPTTTSPTTTSPTTTSPTTTGPAPPVALTISSLRLTGAVTAPQGHARLLVGARLSAPATLTITIRRPGQATDLRTATGSTHPAGRDYLLVDAVDARGYQLPAGRYVVRVQAADAAGDRSNVLSGATTITLTGPLGILDAFTVPFLPPFARQEHRRPGGELVAVVAPRGAAARAGLRRGDVILSLAGTPTSTPGEMRQALADVSANVPITIVVRRGARLLTLQATLPPDWTPAPDYRPALRVALRRDRSSLALRYAQVRLAIEAGRTAAARRLLGAWSPRQRRGAVGSLLAGDIALAAGNGAAAVAAYERASAREPRITPPLLGEGLGDILIGQYGAAADALGRAAALDPTDASVQATQSFALLRLDRPADALAAADRALAADPTSSEGMLARGIALVATGDRNGGLRVLRAGLLLTSDPARAASVIAKNLEPNDP